MQLSLLTTLIVSVISFAILVYSVILHEIAHGWLADRLGDPTAKLYKRLTLDPRPHIDIFYTILLPLFLYLSHIGIVFGAAKPIPIDPFNFRKPKKDTALVALAGPATNLLIAFVLSAVLRVVLFFIINDNTYGFITEILSTGIVLNVTLALFNLIPIPPMDGFKILLGILPDSIARDLAGLERFGLTLIFILLFFFPGTIFGLISPLMHTLTSLLLP